MIPAQQVLLEDGKPVRLGSRAREILTTLAERPGEVVSREELIARVWPDTFVDAGNLKVHIAGIRKALGDGRSGRRYIANIPGRGYSFVGQVLSSHSPAPEEEARSADPPARRGAARRLIGRSATIEALTQKLLLRRFVTVVGPGGMGKTSVALAVGEALTGTLKDGVHFVDLSPLADQLLVPAAVAAALSIPLRAEGSIDALLPILREKAALIILDNCEHLIETAAVLAEEVVREAPHVLLLATSREPLDAEGEFVHRLEPLDAPPPSPALTAAEALEYPAVQLFVERAAASLEGFVLKDSDAGMVAEACRKLDGLALAIELTASRINAFGVHGLAALLDDRFRLLRGRRTAQPRHQTLSATLDWSYVLLTEPEKIVLRRLGVFAGSFTMDAATAVAADGDVPAQQVRYCVANLVAKSFVSASVDRAAPRYRLLDTTRAYARGKLNASRDTEDLARRHAAHCLDYLDEAQAEWCSIPATQWIELHRAIIDDVRAALDWTALTGSDPKVGIALTIAALPLWFELSLVSECHQRVEWALSLAASGDDVQAQMRLSAALGWTLMQTRGLVSETRDAWEATLRHAEAVDDVDFQLRALWGLWAGMLNRCELRPALALANRFHDLARRGPDGMDLFVADRMVGYILHLLGDQPAARRHIERMLAGYETPVIGSQMIRFVFDQKVTARCFLARILWLQGFPDQAVRLVEEIIEEATHNGDMLSLCQALVQAACPIALFIKDWTRLATYVEMLVDRSQRNAFGFFTTWGMCFQGALTVRTGDVRKGLTLLRDALSQLKSIDYGVYYITFLGEFAEALGDTGEPSRGLIAIDEALDRSAENHELWYVPELMRIKAAILLKEDAQAGHAEAEALLLASIESADRHSMPSWRLRSAISLAELWIGAGRRRDATDLVQSVLQTFTEGLETHDVALGTSMVRADAP